MSLGLSFFLSLHAAEPDLIFHHAKVVTVDSESSIWQAISIRDGRILEVGNNEELLKSAGPRTKSIDCEGRMILPGLIDSHAHPAQACMTEFEHPVPDMERIRPRNGQ